MIIKYIAQVIFYGLSALVAVYSAMMVFVLMRFGHSRVLNFIMSGLFVIVMLTLYAAAIGNFLQISFPEFDL